jgi:DNA-binding response OmpR family regulator
MVLLDKMMPGMNGFDVLKRIKSTPELNFLPVILQTAIGSPASVQQGMEAGAFYYLTKPFSRDMLLAVVKAAQSHWDRHQAFRELAKQHLDALAHLQQAEFRLRTLKEAQTVTALLAAPAPSRKSGHRPVRADGQRHRAWQPGHQLSAKNPIAGGRRLGGRAGAPPAGPDTRPT